MICVLLSPEKELRTCTERRFYGIVEHTDLHCTTNTILDYNMSAQWCY